jgi:hypothetical protein
MGIFMSDYPYSTLRRKRSTRRTRCTNTYAWFQHKLGILTLSNPEYALSEYALEKKTLYATCRHSGTYTTLVPNRSQTHSTL